MNIVMPKALGVNEPSIGIRMGGPEITKRMPKALGVNRRPMGIRMGGLDIIEGMLREERFI